MTVIEFVQEMLAEHDVRIARLQLQLLALQKYLDCPDLEPPVKPRRRRKRNSNIIKFRLPP